MRLFIAVPDYKDMTLQLLPSYLLLYQPQMLIYMKLYLMEQTGGMQEDTSILLHIILIALILAPELYLIILFWQNFQYFYAVLLVHYTLLLILMSILLILMSIIYKRLILREPFLVQLRFHLL